jgi:hypothetical protein
MRFASGSLQEILNLVAELLLGNEFFEFLAGGESRNGFRSDFQLFAGLRVATGASSALAGLESAEANQGNFLTFGNGFFDGGDGVGQDLGDLLLGSFGLPGYFLYEFFFIHGEQLLSKWVKHDYTNSRAICN